MTNLYENEINDLFYCLEEKSETGQEMLDYIDAAKEYHSPTVEELIQKYVDRGWIKEPSIDSLKGVTLPLEWVE